MSVPSTKRFVYHTLGSTYADSFTELPWIPIAIIFLILAAALGGLILIRRNN